MQQLKGVSISQGLAVGKIVVLTSAAAPETQAGTPEEELARIKKEKEAAAAEADAYRAAFESTAAGSPE